MVTRPKELGGLGLFDIRKLSWALRAIWPWLQMTEPDKPWTQFQIHVCKDVQSLIDMAMVTKVGDSDMAVVTKVGDGSNTLFWKDRWLNGKRIKHIAPAVYAMVPKRIINTRKAKEAMLNLRWVTNFQGALAVPVLVEYFDLYQIVSYSTPTSRNQKLKLMRKDRQFTYSLTLPLMCSPHRRKRGIGIDCNLF
jgi:hypothetical protein